MKDYFVFVTSAAHPLQKHVEVRCIMPHGMLCFHNGEYSYDLFGQDGVDADQEFKNTVENHHSAGWLEIE